MWPLAHLLRAAKVRFVNPVLKRSVCDLPKCDPSSNAGRRNLWQDGCMIFVMDLTCALVQIRTLPAG